MSTKRPSFRDVLKARQQKKLQEDFVGRTDERSRFERNLDLAFTDRAFIFNVAGQGGIGKTYLLRHFRQLVEEHGGMTVWTDESQQSVVSTMAHFAEEFKKHGIPLESFTKNYAKYEERRRELLATSDAPKDLAPFLNRTIRASIKLATHVPTVGPVFELLDDETVSTWMGNAGEFIARTLKDKSDIRLIQEPIETLTPLFLQDLYKLPEQRLLAFFFDTYENTSPNLDNWLRALLSQTYGDVPANIILTIAGRSELERERWAPLEDAISRISLEPFTRDEVRTYLHQHGIAEEPVFDQIYRETRGLPVMVAFMAAPKPREATPTTSPTDTLVQRFLKWTVDPRERQVTLDAAFPRWFNKDTLTPLLGSLDIDALFSWLRAMPFVHERIGSSDGGWEYHSIVRHPMLRHVQRESPEHWSHLHGRMGKHYEQLRDNLQLPPSVQQHDETWRKYALEALYHRTCEGSLQAQTSALSGFMVAMKVQRNFARSWAETIKQAEEDTNLSPSRRIGDRLIEAIAAIEGHQYLAATSAFTFLLEREDLEKPWRAAVLDWRGYLFLLAEKNEEALRDLEAAVDLDPDQAEYLIDKGAALYHAQRYEEAIQVLDRALQLQRDQPGALVLRGMAQQWSGQHAQAIEDFTRAIELNSPEPAILYMQRSMLRWRLGDLAKALNDLDQAITNDPKNPVYLFLRMPLLLSLGDTEQAAHLALELDTRALDVVRELAPYPLRELSPQIQEKVKHLIRGVGADPDTTMPFIDEFFDKAPQDAHGAAQLLQGINRIAVAEHYCRTGNLDKALDALNEAVKLTPSIPALWFERAKICSEAGNYEEALLSLDRAGDLVPDEAEDTNNIRGLLLANLEKYDEAISCYEKALSKEPEDVNLLYNIAIAKSRSSGVECAQDEITRARRALEAIATTEERAIALYGLGGLEAIAGDGDRALELLNEACLADPAVLAWIGQDIAWLELRDDLRLQALLASLD